MFLMSEVSKEHGDLSIQSNVTHVKGVKSGSICTIRAVMLCMSKVLKEVQNGLTHFCLSLSYYSTDFQSQKSFEKLGLRAFQPYHQMHCMSKQDGGVKG